MLQILQNGVISAHGMIISLSLILMMLYSFSYASKKKYDTSTLLYLSAAAVFFGFAGSRLFYVMICDQLYVDAAEKWRLTDGGYALFGAFFGVILTVAAYCLIFKKKKSFVQIMDTLCVSAPLAIALGRLGSIFSEDCFGEVVERDGLKFFPIAIMSRADGEYHYAVFFYEALYCLAIFLIITAVDRRTQRPGVPSFLFPVLYGGGRALFESMRTDSMYVAFVRVNQVLAIFTVIGMFIYISVKLCRITGFKKKYIISYLLFAAAFFVAFLSEFYMYSTSKAVNTFQILICCIVMTVITVFTGYRYALYSAKKKNQKNTAQKKKKMSDKTQRFNRIPPVRRAGK